MSSRELVPSIASAVIPAPTAQRVDVLEPPAAGLTLRSNFGWILSGNVAYAMCQWGVIVALAKLGSSYLVGQFSLGLAIATPVFMLTNLHLRAVQATDARRMYSFPEYRRLRTATTMAGLIASAAIVTFGRYERRTAMVILAVSVAKGIETISDIHYGLFQLNDRLDQSAKSMMLRGALSVLALTAGVYFCRSIVWGCIALAAVWLGALLFFDAPNGRRLAGCRDDAGQVCRPRRVWRLVCTALPLGIAATMAALNLNIPRYFIHARMGERQLGIYSALAYATAAMILVSDSMAHSAIPRLSRFYSAGRLDRTRALLLRLVAAGLITGMGGLAVVHVAGRRLLMLVYGSEYAAQYPVFLLLIGAAAIYCVACMFTSAITAARCFRVQLPLYALVVGANVLACARWVPDKGLAGAAAGMLAAAAVHLVFGAAVAGRLLRAPHSPFWGRGPLPCRPIPTESH